jgi:molybdopterin-binding protein
VPLTTPHVKIEIAPGQVITSSITNESVDGLKFRIGSVAYAVLKSLDVMIAID